jgi:hypothetical protein
MNMRRALSLGASLGARSALVYGLIFVAFGVVRYSVDLSAAPPGGSFWLAYGGGAVSLAVASLGITAIMALLAATLGAVTALCAAAIYWLAKQLGAGAHPAAIGVAVTLLFVLLLHLALAQAGLWTWSSLLDTTYLFWLGIPALVYIMAALVAGRAWQPEVAGQMSA